MKNRLDIILKYTNVVLVASLLFLGIVFATKYVSNNKLKKSVNVGQVWVYNDDLLNPYNADNIKFRIVIDVNGNYVQYVNIYKDTLSVTRKKFIEDSKRLIQE